MLLDSLSNKTKRLKVFFSSRLREEIQDSLRRATQIRWSPSRERDAIIVSYTVKRYLKECPPAALLKWENKQLIYRTPQIETLAIMDMELTEAQRPEVIKARHDDKSAGHPGIAKTIELITRDFTWPGLRKDVEKYIANCDTCAKTKHARHRPYGLLQTPDVGEESWSRIALDFIVKLPKSKEPTQDKPFDSIAVINDTPTKYAYFIPWREKSTAEVLAYVFMRTVVSQHGTPKEIVSDRETSCSHQSFGNR